MRPNRASRSRSLKTFVRAAFLLTALSACGLEVMGALEGVDASTLPDGSAADAEPNEDAGRGRDGNVAIDGPEPLDGGDEASALDSSFLCGDARVSTCEGCSAGQSLCRENGQCVPDCKTGCGDAQVECIACTTDGQRARSVCEPRGSSTCALPPFARCPCTDAGDCPGPRQVCLGVMCFGCGEPGSDKQLCKGPPSNKHCDDDNTGNPADNMTCR